MVAPATDSPLGSTPWPPLPGARSPRPRRGGGGPEARKAASAARVGLREAAAIAAAAAGRQRHLEGGGGKGRRAPGRLRVRGGLCPLGPAGLPSGTHPVQQVTDQDCPQKNPG